MKIISLSVKQLEINLKKRLLFSCFSQLFSLSLRYINRNELQKQLKVSHYESIYNKREFTHR